MVPTFTYKTVDFENEHGERFKLTKGILGTVTMCGDETDHETIDLFNPEFSIWSREELKLLGNALIKLSEA